MAEGLGGIPELTEFSDNEWIFTHAKSALTNSHDLPLLPFLKFR